MRMISELAVGESPVVGDNYLVPCVDLSSFTADDFERGLPRSLRQRIGLMNCVPVLGHSHFDPEFPGAGGETMHIHLDVRFMNMLEVMAWGMEEENGIVYHNHRYHPAIPIVPTFNDRRTLTPTLRRKMCQRLTPDFTNLTLAGEYYEEFESKMEEKEASIKLDKPICPHQGTPLGGIAPVDGMVTCPLHGLGFCAKTGKMVRKTKRHNPATRRPDSFEHPRFHDGPSKYSEPARLTAEERKTGCSV